MDLLDRCKAIFGKVKASPTQLPSLIDIPPERAPQVEKLGTPLKKDQHYFQVRVNELFLTDARQWFAVYDPMVFVSSEFIYLGRKDPLAVPFVVGPSMLKEQVSEKIPTGMVFSDTRVAGIHPYRGSKFSLLVILYRVKRDDWARKMLGVVESAGKALDFGSAIEAYTKVAGAVLDGVDALLELGNTVPVLGQRREINPEAGDELKPGYFAMIDLPDTDPILKKLWVFNNRLHFGSTREEAETQHFRSADYLLYSISSRPDREDDAALPFFPLWEQVKKEASVPTQEGWQSAKANMLSLYQAMMLSPELTETHAFVLTDDYKTRMKKIWDNAVEMGRLNGAATGKMAELRERSLDILKM